MGWLPIALALVGFVFFVFIVNYSSIKRHEEAIILSYFNFCQTAKARHTLLINLKEKLPDDSPLSFPEKDFNLKRYSEYHFKLKKEMQSIEQSRQLPFFKQPSSAELRKKYKSLEVLNHRQHINVKVFHRKVREYNTLITSWPTAMVARATCCKPLKP